MIRFVVVFFFMAFSACAETLPALYRVTGVASDDVLNVRAEPNASSEKRGELAYNATGVEVVEMWPDQTWAQVNVGETSGWVSMRYITREEESEWYDLAQPLSCYGTEPFWNLNIPAGDGAMVLQRMGEDYDQAFGRTVTSPAFDWPRTIGFSVQGPAREGFAVIRAEGCTDGMSDRVMGLTFRMFLSAPSGDESYIGCCTLQQ